MEIKKYKKKWYKDNKKRLRALESTPEYLRYRNARILLKKLMNKLPKGKMSPAYYPLIEEIYNLTIIIKTFRRDIQN